MKKIFMFAALAACFSLTTVSCNNDDDAAVASNSGQVMAFDVLSSNSLTTRGIPVTTSNYTSQQSNFAVFGFFSSTATGTGVTANAQYVGGTASTGTYIGYSSSAWNYETPSELSYWPATTAPLDFYAVSPKAHDNPTKNIAYNSQTLTYEVPTDNKEQADLMYAGAMAMTNESSTVVPLYFKHATCGVKFAGKITTTSLNVEIADIAIKNVKKSGVFTLANGTTTAAAAGAGEWTTVDNAWADYAVDIDDPVTLTTSAAALGDADDVLLMIPQTTTAWTTTPSSAVTTSSADGSHETYLAITCKIRNYNNGTAGAYFVGDASNYGTVYIPFGETWAQSTLYTYTLNFEGAGYDEDGNLVLAPITYTVSVQDMSTDSDQIDL